MLLVSSSLPRCHTHLVPFVKLFFTILFLPWYTHDIINNGSGRFRLDHCHDLGLLKIAADRKTSPLLLEWGNLDLLKWCLLL